MSRQRGEQTSRHHGGSGRTDDRRRRRTHRHRRRGRRETRARWCGVDAARVAASPCVAPAADAVGSQPRLWEGEESERLRTDGRNGGGGGTRHANGRYVLPFLSPCACAAVVLRAHGRCGVVRCARWCRCNRCDRRDASRRDRGPTSAQLSAGSCSSEEKRGRTHDTQTHTGADAGGVCEYTHFHSPVPRLSCSLL